MLIRASCAGVALLWLCGCATLGNGVSQQVGIASVPAAAHVIVDGNDSGVTPLVLKLARKSHHQIRIERPGYAAQEFTVGRQLSWWGVSADALLLFQPVVIISGVVYPYATPLAVGAMFAFDWGMGGLFKLVPEHLTATLVPAQPPPRTAP